MFNIWANVSQTGLKDGTVTLTLVKLKGKRLKEKNMKIIL